MAKWLKVRIFKYQIHVTLASEIVRSGTLDIFKLFNDMYWEGDILNIEQETEEIGIGEVIFIFIIYKYKYGEMIHMWKAIKSSVNGFMLIEKLRNNDSLNNKVYKREVVQSTFQKIFIPSEDLEKIIPLEFETAFIKEIFLKADYFYSLVKDLLDNNFIEHECNYTHDFFDEESENLESKNKEIISSLGSIQMGKGYMSTEQIHLMLGARYTRLLVITLLPYKRQMYALEYDNYELVMQLSFYLKRLEMFKSGIDIVDSALDDQLKTEAYKKLLEDKIFYCKKLLNDINDKRDVTVLSKTFNNFQVNNETEEYDDEETDTTNKKTDNQKIIYNPKTDEQRKYRNPIYNQKIDEITSEMQMMPKLHGEYLNKKQLLEYLINLPHKPSMDLEDAVERVQNQLEKTHYGHAEIKQELSEYIFELIHSNKENRENKSICLVGEPGIGKTTIVESIAKGLNRPLIRISMGGVDFKYLIGHSQTYLNAKPGILIESFSKLKFNDPVILIDEIDKIPIRDSPFGVLMEVLDPHLSKTFKDHYLNLEYDISNALIICTANNTSEINYALANRMLMYHLEGYDIEDKFYIAKKYIWQKLINKYDKFDPINIPDDILYQIIERNTYESGVRQLVKILNKIYIRVLQHNAFLNKDNVPLLGVEKEVYSDLYQYELPFDSQITKRYNNKDTMIGLSTSSNGGVGHIITISTAINEKDGLLVNMPSNDKTATLSAKLAQTYINSFNKTKFVSSYSPVSIACAGTSAGLAMTIAYYKYIKDINVVCAATGEIDLHGYIGAIGGLSAKLSAAKKYNIPNVFIPKNNKEDYNRYIKTKGSDKNIKVYLVSHFKEVAYILNKLQLEKQI